MTLRASTLAVAVLLFLTAPPAFAQPPDPAVTSSVRPSIDWGVRFGPAFTSLSSVDTFDATVVAAANEPTMNFGGFVTLDLPGPLAFQAEILFAAKGQRVRDQDAPPVVTGTGVKPAPADRVILLRYLEIPLLFRMSRQTRTDTSVYLIAGPAPSLRRNAVFRQVADSGKLEDISEMIARSNLSVVIGAGLQHQRWLVDARMTKGLRNVAVEPQPSTVKTSAFAVLMGVRL